MGQFLIPKYFFIEQQQYNPMLEAGEMRQSRQLWTNSYPDLAKNSAQKTSNFSRLELSPILKLPSIHPLLCV